MSNQIGIGIVTCNRKPFFDKLLESVKDTYPIYVANSGDELYGNVSGVGYHHKFHQKTPVVFAKNHLLRTMYSAGVDHIFILEDDVLVNDKSVFDRYVKAAIKSGLFHLNFGFSQKENLDDMGKPVYKNVVDYGDGIRIVLTQNILGAFSYYYKGVIKNVGLMDEMFNENSFEHVEHTYRIIKAGLLPSFWNFPDIDKSWEYISNQGSFEDTVIRNAPEYKTKMVRALSYFEKKHNFKIFDNLNIPQEQILMQLNEIEKNYGNKITI